MIYPNGFVQRVDAGSTYYNNFFGAGLRDSSPSNNDVRNAGICPFDATITIGSLTTSAPGTSNTLTFSVMKNGTQVATCSVSGAGTTGTWDVTSFNVVAGDYLSVKVVASASATSTGYYFNISVDGGGDSSVILSGNNNNATHSTTLAEWTPPCGQRGLAALAATNSLQTSEAGTIAVVAAALTTAPAAGKSRLFEVYLNNVATGVSATISGTNTAALTSGGSAAVAISDVIDVRNTPTSSPAATFSTVSVKFAPTTPGRCMYVNRPLHSNSTGNVQMWPSYGTDSVDSGAGLTPGNGTPLAAAITLDLHYFWRVTAPGVGHTATLTLQDNEVDTSVAVAVSGASTSNNSTSTKSFLLSERLRWNRTGSASTVASLEVGASSGHVNSQIQTQFMVAAH